MGAVTSAFSDTPVQPWLTEWLPRVNDLIERNGDAPRWRSTVAELPLCRARTIGLDRDAVTIGMSEECPSLQRKQIERGLRQLCPWRKGPFALFGVEVDSEWRSDWKWARLESKIQPLTGRKVLDVGCGNGYYAWRMLGAGAEVVLAIDPSMLCYFQFRAMVKYVPTASIVFVPVAAERLAPELGCFDTVFSMGVLYHRRCPIDHLLLLRDCLRVGGELVLETLVLPEESGQLLVPAKRYAKMRNVWFIPTVPTLIGWLERCGFVGVRVADVTVTSVDEQRRTAWMSFESLADFLNPQQPDYTVEGYPAPRRAILLARR